MSELIIKPIKQHQNLSISQFPLPVILLCIPLLGIYNLTKGLSRDFFYLLFPHYWKSSPSTRPPFLRHALLNPPCPVFLHRHLISLLLLSSSTFIYLFSSRRSIPWWNGPVHRSDGLNCRASPGLKMISSGRSSADARNFQAYVANFQRV